ncbi:heat shock factor protein-like isoform X2 [Homarus americanus]|uniref:heat shock factor protein-like isoform X2 n=1 Tax=Homarus americanus TaxID=6706 RepID=UPI001C4901D4|nr:heat shock factor protein-like isoform X2 [Homarus americanus]
MHAIEGSGNVPAFLTKLWRLVDDAKTNDLISWTQNGRSFIIQNQAKFARDLLPQYYKHNNMASFVRQLNMYGFHKVVSADSGGLRVERDDMEFAHPHFLRGQEALIENIKRKQQRRLASDGVDFSQIPTSRTMIIEENKSVSKLLNEVRDMKRDHESMSTKLLGLKRENEALWREYASMRQKFSKQQQIIEKLIHFLIAMVKSPSKTLVPKRKFGHLALEGGEENSSSSTKINPLPQFSQGTPIDVSFSQLVGDCEGGAQIQEVTDLVDADDPNIFLPDDDNPIKDTFYGMAAKLPEVDKVMRTPAGESSNNIMEPETVLTVNGEIFQFPEISIQEQPILASSIISPGGTDLDEGTRSKFTHSTLLDEAPLSPELLNTVDPSAVTQSFKYDVNESPVLSSSGAKSTMAPSTSTSSTSAKSQVHKVAQKGKIKAVKTEKSAPQSSSMSVAVPEKNMQKQELQTHLEDMQTTIDSLQDLLNAGNFNVEPSMLLTLFGSDDGYLPELDSLSPVANGNELSLYNPSLLDLAGDMEEEEDPLSFLNSGNFSSSMAPSSTSPASSAASSNSSTGPTQPKQLRLSIKKERVETDSLETPKILSPDRSPVHRGKRRTN